MDDDKPEFSSALYRDPISLGPVRQIYCEQFAIGQKGGMLTLHIFLPPVGDHGSILVTAILSSRESAEAFRDGLLHAISQIWPEP